MCAVYINDDPCDYCLSHCSNCGMKDPSWLEIRHFIKFLDVQLQSCEESVYCDETLVGDVMSGLKSFVVKFMVHMSRDFATSSLQGEVAREEGLVEDNENGNLGQYQIVRRRCWEERYAIGSIHGVSNKLLILLIT